MPHRYSGTYMRMIGVALAWQSVVGCSASVPQHFSSRSIFSCDGGREFLVESTDAMVVVTYKESAYPMKERPSSLGRKFQSDAGTLIIDGEFAALVLSTDRNFEDCHEISGDKMTL